MIGLFGVGFGERLATTTAPMGQVLTPCCHHGREKLPLLAAGRHQREGAHPVQIGTALGERGPWGLEY